MFEVDPFRKFCLLEGLDDIGLTLRHAAELDKYEAEHDEAALAEGEVSQPALATTSTGDCSKLHELKTLKASNGYQLRKEQMTIEGKRQSIPLTEGPSRAAARSYLRGPDSAKTICTSRSSASPTPGPRSAPATCICAKWPRR